MGREREVKNPEKVGTQVEREVFDELVKIQHREGMSSLHKLTRKIINEYVKAHAEGNDTFKLDVWNDNPAFKAVPTISSRSEIWYKYLQSCTGKELTNFMVLTNRINQQCKAIKGIK